MPSPSVPFDTVLIANRGEIAVRIIRTLRRLGMRSVAVYSDADRGARHVAEADTAVRIGPSSPQESYLSIEAIIAAAKATDAGAIHPGYGFLSENPAFARACEAAGLVFIGPSTRSLELMGDKIRAKEHVAAAGVPVIESVTSLDRTDAELIEAASGLGFPLLIKPSAGGGGKGMYPVYEAGELAEAIASARRVASAAFGDDTLLIERLIPTPRHIEVQLLADSHGGVIHLGERECSLQRRHQKVIEEAPSPLLDPATRERIGEAAKTVARSVDYVGAGTVEFLVSAERPDEFFFMEMNTRLQVEHPVTELITGIDLVEWQVRVAGGEPLALGQADIHLTGHAIEARVYAEDPERGFLPSTGTVLALGEPSGEGVRVDSSLAEGLTISPDYDPMLSKVIAWGPDRPSALARLDAALADTTVLGVRTNIEYLRLLLADPEVASGAIDTGLIARRLPDIRFACPDPASYAAAALAARGACLPGAWGASRGWRTAASPALPPHVFAHPADERVTVTIAGDTATIDGVEHALRIIADDTADGAGRITLELDGTVSTIAVAQDGGTVWVGRSGCAWPLTRLTREAQLRASLAQLERELHPASPEVRSPMPGTVVSVSAATGDEVEVGATIATIEAMKMEHRLTAPVAGVVTVTVAPGGLVKLDEVVATITPHAEARGDEPQTEHQKDIDTHKEQR